MHRGIYFPFLVTFVLSRLNNVVTLYHSGVKNADEAELRQVASEPVDLNVYNVNDFPLLSRLVARLVHILCGRIEERGVSKRNPLSISCFSFGSVQFSFSMNVVLILCCWVSRNGAQSWTWPNLSVPQSYWPPFFCTGLQRSDASLDQPFTASPAVQSGLPQCWGSESTGGQMLCWKQSYKKCTVAIKIKLSHFQHTELEQLKELN